MSWVQHPSTGARWSDPVQPAPSEGRYIVATLSRPHNGLKGNVITIFENQKVYSSLIPPPPPPPPPCTSPWWHAQKCLEQFDLLFANTFGKGAIGLIISISRVASYYAGWFAGFLFVDVVVLFYCLNVIVSFVWVIGCKLFKEIIIVLLSIS